MAHENGMLEAPPRAHLALDQAPPVTPPPAPPAEPSTSDPVAEARQQMEAARRLMEEERTRRGQLFMQQVKALAEQYRCELLPEVTISAAGVAPTIRVRVLD